MWGAAARQDDIGEWTTTPGMTIDWREVVYVLSGVLDFVGVTDVQHGKRVAFMAHAIGCALGLKRHALDRLFEAALLHDAGVSTTREHDKLISQYSFLGVNWHSVRGQDLVLRVPALAPLAPIIAYHHTPWPMTAEARALDRDSRLAANIIFLADRVDALLARNPGLDPAMQRQGIFDALGSRYADQYAPEILDAFRAVADRDAFWFALDGESLLLELAPLARSGVPRAVSHQDVRALATLFAHVVDAKSPFTAEHSDGVGRLSTHLACRAGLGEDKQDQIEIAALLHDVGKLRIPDELLDKPGPLDTPERVTMNRHVFYTYQILRQIQGFDDIALWAAQHHEALDGGGYPFATAAPELSLESRIIAVADIFQALAQDRPYRPAMDSAEILKILDRLAVARKIDGDLVALLADSPEESLALARGRPV